MKRAFTLVFPVALTMLLVQCKKDPTNAQWRPTYALPLAEAEMSIGDVVGARPSEVLSEYAFGSGTDSTFFFKLIYTDTLDPIQLLQFQNTGGTYTNPITIRLPERRMYLRMLGKSKNGEFQFTNPEVEFSFDNYTNMAYTLGFDSIFTKNIQSGNKYYFQLADGAIDVSAGDATLGGITDYRVTNADTDPTGALTVVFEPTPKYLYYYPVLTSLGGSNISGSEVRLYAKVILPFEGKGSISYSDTAALPSSLDDNAVTDILDFAYLRFHIVNGIPLDAILTGTIIDTTTGTVIAELPLYDVASNEPSATNLLIPGASMISLDPSTNPTTTPETLTSEVRIYRDNPYTGEDDIALLASGNAIIWNLQFTTTGFEQDEIVKIFSTQKLKINLGLKTRADVSIEVPSVRDSVLSQIR
jgi:hypothetical protein